MLHRMVRYSMILNDPNPCLKAYHYLTINISKTIEDRATVTVKCQLEVYVMYCQVQFPIT